MKRPSKKELKEFMPDFKIQVYALPTTIAVFVIVFALMDLNVSEFPYDNARYAYSAIFQGFAAILAIMITAILITFQNIHAQKFGIEERIYKILGNRYPTYIPSTLNQIKHDVDESIFKEKFLDHATNFTELTTPQQFLLVTRIIEEIKRKFDFLENQERHETYLRRVFIISLGLIVVIIIYSLTALVLVPTDGKSFENSIININPIHALMILVFLVFMALMMIAQFMVSILNLWKLKSD